MLVEDRYVAAPISDDAGRPLPRAQMRALLAAALREAPSAESGFTTVSSLGSELAAPLLAELLTDPGNAATYERLTQALFLVRLDDGDDSTVEQLRRGAFEPGQAWAYKTFTYQLGLGDGFAATHMEHTAIDGGTLKAVVAAAQQVPDEPSGATDEIDSGAGSVAIEPLTWRLTAQQRDRLALEAARYARAAADHRLELVRVDAPRTDHLSFRVSDDAVQQWLFLYAQLATYGRIRSTYESVDMRHMQAGRTECLRAITPEAVALVSALLPGSASSGSAGETDKAALVDAALAAHKRWVQDCKTGQGSTGTCSGSGWRRAVSVGSPRCSTTPP